MFNIIKEVIRNQPLQFNHELFQRDVLDIVDEIKKLIKSIERESVFKITVLGFSTITDFNDIREIQKAYYDSVIKTRKKGVKENKYDCINVNDSDVIVLLIEYRIVDCTGASEDLVVPLYIPRFVDKYYMHVQGIDYIPLLQLVDGATYNKPKGGKYRINTVIGKTLFGAIKLYDNFTANNIVTTDGQVLDVIIYTANIYKRLSPAMLFILAKHGLNGSMQYLGLKYIYINQYELNLDPEVYYHFIFGAGINLYVPKLLYNNDKMTQSFIGSLIQITGKNDSIRQIIEREYWVIKLAESVKFTTASKGYSTLQQLETLFDPVSSDKMLLPEEDKSDIYSFLRWMMREFDPLCAKSNYSIKGKRLRLGEYFAHIYATKLGAAFSRLNNKERSTKLSTIRSILNIDPEILITKIHKTGMFEVRDIPNDLDTKLALKFSMKGPAGLGQTNETVPKRGGKGGAKETKKSYIPPKFRHVNPSHIGPICPYTSAKSDPGTSATLNPGTELYEYKYLAEYQEPNTWRAKYAALLQEFEVNNISGETFFEFNHKLDYGKTRTKKSECEDREVEPVTEEEFFEFTRNHITFNGVNYKKD